MPISLFYQVILVTIIIVFLNERFFLLLNDLKNQQANSFVS